MLEKKKTCLNIFLCKYNRASEYTFSSSMRLFVGLRREKYEREISKNTGRA